MRAFAALVLASLMAVAGVTTSAQAAQPADDVVTLTNQQRAASGMPTLIEDATLDSVAQAWASEMNRMGKMEHSTNDWRAARIPKGWFTNGENIAYGYSSATSVMQDWMKSPGHKENILRKSYTHIGVGYVASGNYWVQIFAGYDRTKAAAAYGNFDEAVASVAPDSASLTARGWAVDGLLSTESLAVHIWVADPRGTQTRYIVSANQSRPDIARAFDGAGAEHGFSVTVPAKLSGNYTVCPSAIAVVSGVSKIVGLGCKNVVVGPSKPMGSLDQAVVTTDGALASISLRGWAMDDVVRSSSTPVHVYITSPAGRTSSFALNANASRVDVGAAFAGAGANHGFESTTPITEPGRYRVCVYAIGGSVFVDSHTGLGCRDLSFGPSLPIGAFDSVSVAGDKLRAIGWSMDAAFKTVANETHVYVTRPDGRTLGYIAVSDQSRPDVAAAFPGAGANHGYSIDVPTAGAGTYTVCTYPISAKQLGTGHSTLPCKQIRVDN